MPPADWTSQNLQAPIHKLRVGELIADPDAGNLKSVTPNQESHKGTKQKAIWQVADVPARFRTPPQTPNVFFWDQSRSAARIFYATPFDADRCWVYTDDEICGIRSGPELRNPLATGDDEVDLVLPVPHWPAISGSGTVVVGGEALPYKTVDISVPNRSIILGGVTRAPNGGAAHPVRTQVKWFSDPAGITTMIVAHEAGHNVHITHDVTDESVMNQPPPFTPPHHTFRREGAQKGSLQEFKFK